MLSLELPDQDHVVLRPESSFCTELGGNEAHHVVVLAIESGHHGVKVLPRGFSRSQFNNMGILVSL